MRARFGSGVAIVVALTACAQPDVNASSASAMDVFYYTEGERTEAELDDRCRERVPEILEELVAGTTEMLRLLVSEERIQEIRETRAVEVVFDESRRFTSEALDAYDARRVLVPLQEGDYAGDEENPRLTIFLGDESYQTGPLLHPSGLPLGRELEACAGGPPTAG